MSPAWAVQDMQQGIEEDPEELGWPKPAEIDGQVPGQSKIHANSSVAVDQSLHWISCTHSIPAGAAFAPVAMLMLAGDCKLLGKQRWAHSHGGHQPGATLTSPPPCARRTGH